MSGYKIIDHTADIGIKVEGGTLPELFVNSAEATFDLLFSVKKNLVPSIEVPVVVDAPSLEQLFVKWLQELLYLYETRRLVLSKFWIDEIDEKHLTGVVWGQKFDSTRHKQKLSIKAVTYHKLQLIKISDSLWHAEVIFDI